MNEANVTSPTTEGSEVERVVMCEITLNDILEMRPQVPFAVQIRLRLNKCGFKFEDDHKPSLVINKEPKPLGKMVCWEDYETGSLHYKQILNT